MYYMAVLKDHCATEQEEEKDESLVEVFKLINFIVFSMLPVLKELSMQLGGVFIYSLFY